MNKSVDPKKPIKVDLDVANGVLNLVKQGEISLTQAKRMLIDPKSIAHLAVYGVTNHGITSYIPELKSDRKSKSVSSTPYSPEDLSNLIIVKDSHTVISRCVAPKCTKSNQPPAIIHRSSDGRFQNATEYYEDKINAGGSLF